MFKKTLLILFSASLILLTGCKNFISGSDLTEEIKETIKFSNTKFVDVTMEFAEEEHVAFAQTIPVAGTITKTYKPGDTLQVSCITNPNYELLEWEAVPSGSVIFKDATQKMTAAKIVKFVEGGIKIRPRMKIIPTVISFYPSMEPNGVFQDTSIVINFSKPVNPEDFFYNPSVISIEELGVDKSDYFMPPKFVNNNKTMVIETNKQECLLKVDSKDVMELTVTLDLNGKTDAVETDNYPFAPGPDEGGKYIYKYRVNKTTDISAPVVNEVHILNGKTNSLDLEDKRYYITDSSKMYVQISGKDNNRIASVQILNDSVKNSDDRVLLNDYISEEEKPDTEGYSESNYNIIREVNIDRLPEGDFNFSVYFIDDAGNFSVSPYKVIASKKTAIHSNLRVVNPDLRQNIIDAVTKGTTDLTRNFSFYLVDDLCDNSFYDSFYPFNKLPWKLEYGNSEDELIKKNYTDYELAKYIVSEYYDRLPVDEYGNRTKQVVPNKGIYNKLLTIDDDSIDTSKPLYLKFSTEDIAGNTLEVKTVLLPKPRFKKIYFRRAVNTNGTYEWNDDGDVVFLCYEPEFFENFSYFDKTEVTAYIKTGSSVLELSMPYVGSKCLISGRNYDRLLDYSYDYEDKKALDVCFKFTEGSVSNTEPVCFMEIQDEEENELPKVQASFDNVTVESCGRNTGKTKIIVTLDNDKFIQNGSEYTYDFMYLKGDTEYITMNLYNDYRQSVLFHKNDSDKWTASLEVNTKILLQKNTGNSYSFDQDGNYKFIVGAKKGNRFSEIEISVPSNNSNIKWNEPPAIIDSTNGEYSYGKKIRLSTPKLGAGVGINKVLCFYSKFQKEMIPASMKTFDKDGTEKGAMTYNGHAISPILSDIPYNYKVVASAFSKGIVPDEYIMNYFSCYDLTDSYLNSGLNSENLYFPTSELDDDEYILLEYLEDDTELHNYSLTPLRYYKKNKLEIPFEKRNFQVSNGGFKVYSYFSSGNGVAMDMTGSVTDILFGINEKACISYGNYSGGATWYMASETYLYDVSIYDEQNGIWKEVMDNAYSYADKATNERNNTSLFPNSVMPPVRLTKDSENKLEHKFIKIGISKHLYYDNKISYKYAPMLWSAPMYYYTGFDSSNGKRCEVADIYEGARGLVVLASDPCIIYTISSDVKDYGDNPEDWDYYCGEDAITNTRVFMAGEGNSMTSYIPVKGGTYSRVIVHFADGTSAISKPL